MSFMDAMEITASGLSASRLRMNIISSNLANAQTTRGVDGGPYKRKDAVFEAARIENQFDRILSNKVDESLRGVAVSQVVEDTRPPRAVHDPGHPDADEKGMVQMPNVNVVEEMVDMIMASRSYEAGITAMQTVKSMAQKALQIGGR